MKIVNIEPQTILNWKREFEHIEGEKKATLHWKPGRSAYSLAEFIIKNNGENRIIKAVNNVLPGDSISSLDEARIECKCRFDQYRSPRRQDMGIVGTTNAGKRIFIGVEAKVDESFGPRLNEALRRANPLGNAANRIRNLCEKFGVQPTDGETKGLRYQLFHFTAGTAFAFINGDFSAPNANCDNCICVMLTLVFKTSEYDDKTGERNKQEYDLFVKRFFRNHRLVKCKLPCRPYEVYCEIDMRSNVE